MTALRPERDSSGAPYDASDARGDDGAFEAAVDHLDDPLTDPLPGQHPSPWFRSGQGGPGEEQQPPLQPQQQSSPRGGAQDQEWYDPEGYARDWYGQQAAPQQPHPQPHPQHQPQPWPQSHGTPEPTYEQLYGAYAPEPVSVSASSVSVSEAERISADGLRADEADSTAARPTAARPTAARPADPRPTEGRAARRKAAKKGGARTRSARPAGGKADARPAGSSTGSGPSAAGAPRSRLEARRAERARKPSPGAVISRGLGEVFITVGVLMLLFVTYQLWWTNIRAHQQANGAAHDLQESWAKGKGKPGSFEPGQGFALLHIPRLDVVVPVAEGISKHDVLDRGMVGHYDRGATKTAMPEAKKGNFAVAGHRNTHGEPFRYINRLEPGDPIVVETRDKYFVYKMASILPQTAPSNTSVIAPVPRGSGFTQPGRYITLTTCTPEFTSKYRMIVWGKMVEERPRSKGKPSALVN
ncbi:class E sortase [Streptomyces sp. NPDC047123]|uniref:class E sortase n=1 Tax=Streptomyces sp. NPDC047123 TaxID=3155622 RepID=UPI0033CD0239